MNEQPTEPTGTHDLAILKQQIITQASAEIEAVLQNHGCRLNAVPTFTSDGRITAQIQLIVV